MHISTNPWTWIAAFLTLAIFSFLYRDNPIYKFAEHLFVGISAGYGASLYYHNNIVPNIIDPIGKGQYHYIIPLFLGLLYIAIVIPKISYLIRWPFAFVLGVGTGLAIPRSFETNIIVQMGDTFLKLPNQYPSLLSFINAVLIFIGVLTILSYFFFSRPHKGIFGTSARIGIIFLMIGFGASFGYTVMARISLLIGRIQFLLGDWLGIIKF
jgi:hypothetical protein